VHIQQFRVLRLERLQKLVEGCNGRRAKVLQCRMKIDGMNGNDQWKSSRKADPSNFQVLIHIQFTLAGIEVNRPLEMQDSEIIHMGRA